MPSCSSRWSGVALGLLALGGCITPSVDIVDQLPGASTAGPSSDAGASSQNDDSSAAGSPSTVVGSGKPSGGGHGGGSSSGSGGSPPVAIAGNGGTGGSVKPASSKCGVAVCGGNLVGSWSLQNNCTDLDQVNASSQSDPNACAGAQIQSASFNSQSILTFRADGSYATDGAADSALVVYFPASCLGGLTCSQFDSAISAQPGQKSSCVAKSGGCECTLSQSGPAHDSGTYTISGNHVVMSGTTGSFDYCVKGDELHLMVVGATGVVSSDAVMTRL